AGFTSPTFIYRQIIIRSVRLTAAAGLVVVLMPAPARADTSDRFTKTVPLASGKPVRVEATVADVTIVGSDRAALVVEIIRRAPSSADLSKYPVVVEDGPDSVRIAVTQSDDGRDASLRTDISITGPADAVYQAVRVFEGHVRL